MLDCINRLLVGIHTVNLDAELLIEMNDVIIESWFSSLDQKAICATDSHQKETNLIKSLETI